MIPDAVVDALRSAGLDNETLRPQPGALSAQCWSVGDPPVAFVKARPGQPHRIRPELSALLQLQAADFTRAPEVLGVSDCQSAIVLRALRGVALDQAPVTEPSRLFESLGRLVGSLHILRVDVESGMKRSTDPLSIADRVIDTARRDVTRGAGALDDALRWLVEHRPTDLVDTRLVHRDLRAANILVADDEVTGLVDFERACAGDPAWDWVKLRWWCFDDRPDLNAESAFRRGYRRVTPIPHREHVRWFAMAEAIGLATHFAGNYREQALSQVEDLLHGASRRRWCGGSMNVLE